MFVLMETRQQRVLGKKEAGEVIRHASELTNHRTFRML